MFVCGSSTETPAFSDMDCNDEDIEEAHQINADYANDDAEMIDVFYNNEEELDVTHWKDPHNHQTPFDSDDSLDDYDFAKYKKRDQSGSSSEGGDEDEESKASDVDSPSSDEDVTTQAYEFEQGAPLSPSEECDDRPIDCNEENDILSSHSNNDYGDPMYEDDDNGEGMCKEIQANKINQREPSPLSEESNNGSINSDDEDDLLDDDYVPTLLDKDDEDCSAEINSDSDDYEAQEDNDFLYRE